ncbi:MAG TPA: PD-(D/E)XK nuclease family protein, partial [Paludibacter sp.]|nr:PD-(D/E)XK nuclease family protein [Paludibacter sp.]
NTYIDCPMQFYLTKVEDVAEADEVVETVEASMFGTLFHRVMEKLYQPYTGRLIHETDFEQMVSNTPEIDKEIARAFASEYFKKKNNSIVPLEGNNLLIASVLRKYILQVLKIDKKRAPFRYIASEEACNYQLPIFGGRLSVNLKGFIDRIDEKDGHLRIIDYKTGKGKLEFKSLPEVFEHNKENRQKFVLQTFLYALFYKKNAGDRKIIPGIYYLRNLFDDSFDTELRHKPDRSINQPVTDFSIFEEEFCSHLTSCLEEIFDPSIPFVQTENSKACQYCPYTGICNRQ